MVGFKEFYEEAINKLSKNIDNLIKNKLIFTSIRPISKKAKFKLYAFSGDSTLDNEFSTRTIKFPGASALICNAFRVKGCCNHTLYFFYTILDIQTKLADKIPKAGFSLIKKASIMEAMIHEISVASQTDQNALAVLDCLILLLIRYANIFMVNYTHQSKVSFLLRLSIIEAQINMKNIKN